MASLTWVNITSVWPLPTAGSEGPSFDTKEIDTPQAPPLSMQSHKAPNDRHIRGK